MSATIQSINTELMTSNMYSIHYTTSGRKCRISQHNKQDTWTKDK